MIYDEIKEYPLANIVRVEVETEEETPKGYKLTDVASEATVAAYISEGAQNPLRVKNTIKAQNNFEDIVMGYDITLINATMVPEVLALVDGGTLRYDDLETEKVVGYDAPPIGETVERKPYTLHIYTEEKDVNGDTIGYVRFSYLHCKGAPLDYSMQDGEFFTPEMKMKSRPKKGESPASIDFLEELPA